MTAGLLVSAHRAQGQHPWQGWVPCWWVGRGGSLALALTTVNPPPSRAQDPYWLVGLLAQGFLHSPTG